MDTIVHRAFAFLCALAVLPAIAMAEADRAQLIELLDATFKCSREKERYDTGSASSEVKHQYRFSVEDGSLRIATHSLSIGHEVAARRSHSLEQREVATARFSDLEVFASRDPATDATVYLSCKTDKPCISHSIVSHKRTPPSTQRAADDQDAQDAEADRQFDSFAASYHLCDTQTAANARAALDKLFERARAR
jgi:hypothetical protein